MRDSERPLAFAPLFYFQWLQGLRTQRSHTGRLFFSSKHWCQHLADSKRSTWLHSTTAVVVITQPWQRLLIFVLHLGGRWDIKTRIVYQQFFFLLLKHARTLAEFKARKNGFHANVNPFSSAHAPFTDFMQFRWPWLLHLREKKMLSIVFFASFG